MRTNITIHKIIFILCILAFIGNIIYIWNSVAMENTVMGNDEYFFYRTTMNLPDYKTTGVWLMEDCSPYPPEAVDFWADYRFDTAYTTPIWIHPLIPNYIARPIASLFDNPVKQVKWLRLFDVLLIIITAVLFMDIIRKHTNGLIAGISVLPMLVGNFLLANAIIFYNDLFMWLFFAITMWIINRKPESKWIILTSAITVLCKINAPLLIFPIVVYQWYMSNKKVALRTGIISAVAYLSYAVFQAIVAGDALYIFHHWDTLSYARENITANVIPYWWDYLCSWGLWMSLPLIIVGIVLVIKRRLKMWYGFALFGVVTLLYAMGWAFFSYQVQPVMYASMFFIPVVLNEVRNDS